MTLKILVSQNTIAWWKIDVYVMSDCITPTAITDGLLNCIFLLKLILLFK